MLTGLPSPENGVKDYFDPLPTDARTIAHDMNEGGYETAYFGKWHLAHRDPQADLVGETHARTLVQPKERGGFSFWEGFESGFQLNDPWLHGTRIAKPRRFTGYQSDVVCERAAEWLRKRAGWFAIVSLEAPHPPYDAEIPEGIEKLDAQVISLRTNVPRGGDVERRARNELAGYYGHIAATDRAVGRLVQSLSAETIVVVTSVHGDMHGSHGKFRKGWPHEESVRVPLVVRGEGAGASDALVSLLDLPEMTRAWSRGQTWQCERAAAPISMPSVVALPDQGDRVWAGWRTATEKRVFNEDGSPWLSFDLGDDPEELRNRTSPGS